MGVYIANMEKPKSCNECRYKMWTMNETFCNLLDKMLGDEDIRPDCPLIEISETKYHNMVTALDILEHEQTDEEWYDWRDEQEYEDRWERRADELEI